ncbi:hypothetical protein [Acidimangrovimonas pyrenivorans]|uniref:Uncharacterized protein n=1 Tax=Acidimangrovimonas pyrenivorans TaxID=2030798 RepID=A0ABV7AE85_9RHOB
MKHILWSLALGVAMVPAGGLLAETPAADTGPLFLAPSVTVTADGLDRLDAALAGAGRRYAAACCKICRAGKACGNSCISRAKSCHKGPGCACDAR